MTDIRYVDGTVTPDDGSDAREPDITHTPAELLARIWRRPPGNADDPRLVGHWRGA